MNQNLGLLRDCKVGVSAGVTPELEVGQFIKKVRVFSFYKQLERFLVVIMNEIIEYIALFAPKSPLTKSISIQLTS